MPNSWSPTRASRAAVIGAFMGLSAGACATRAVPSAFPADAAASPQAEEAPPAQVGVSLAEDPPLPGEPAGQWTGLEQQKEPPAAGHQQHHHQHGGAPDASPSQPEPDGGDHGDHAQ